MVQGRMVRTAFHGISPASPRPTHPPSKTERVAMAIERIQMECVHHEAPATNESKAIPDFGKCNTFERTPHVRHGRRARAWPGTYTSNTCRIRILYSFDSR